LIGLGSFFLDRDDHGFSLMLGAVVGMIIPGVLLNIARRRKMFKDLDPILHSQLRLSIVSILISVEEASFNFIKDETQATSGNLSIQIKKLQDAGYIKVKKTFKNNYPNTSLSITRKGIEAFEDYVSNLKNYINPKQDGLFG
jgi:DNA-binding MarR family transcriptional regulator